MTPMAMGVRGLRLSLSLSHSLTQPAWFIKMDLCSRPLQNGYKAMADTRLVFGPHEQSDRASSILKQIGVQSPDGTKARAVETLKLS